MSAPPPKPPSPPPAPRPATRESNQEYITGQIAVGKVLARSLPPKVLAKVKTLSMKQREVFFRLMATVEQHPNSNIVANAAEQVVKMIGMLPPVMGGMVDCYVRQLLHVIEGNIQGHRAPGPEWKHYGQRGKRAKLGFEVKEQ